MVVQAARGQGGAQASTGGEITRLTHRSARLTSVRFRMPASCPSGDPGGELSSLVYRKGEGLAEVEGCPRVRSVQAPAGVRARPPAPSPPRRTSSTGLKPLPRAHATRSPLFRELRLRPPDETSACSQHEHHSHRPVPWPNRFQQNYLFKNFHMMSAVNRVSAMDLDHDLQKLQSMKESLEQCRCEEFQSQWQNSPHAEVPMHF